MNGKVLVEMNIAVCPILCLRNYAKISFEVSYSLYNHDNDDDDDDDVINYSFSE